jgi:hypothetical protein
MYEFYNDPKLQEAFRKLAIASEKCVSGFSMLVVRANLETGVAIASFEQALKKMEQTKTTWREAARKAYEEYMKVSGHADFFCNDLPPFETLPHRYQMAWEAAVARAVFHCAKENTAL